DPMARRRMTRHRIAPLTAFALVTAFSLTACRPADRTAAPQAQAAQYPASAGEARTATPVNLMAPAAAATLDRGTELPAGTAVTVRLAQSVDSGQVQSGQAVAATVAEPVMLGGRVVIPAGTPVEGRVNDVRPAKHFGGQPFVGVRFERISLASGERIP